MTNLNIADVIAARQAALAQLAEQRATLMGELPAIMRRAIEDYRGLVARIREVDTQMEQLGAASAEHTLIPHLFIDAGPEVATGGGA